LFYRVIGSVVEFPADTSVLYSIEQNLIDDLKLLRSSPLIRKELAEHSRGFMYDIKTGKLEEVKA
jgi:carbonic anhydrase